MSLPTWFTLDAATVFKNSRLQPQQIEADYDATMTTADVAALILAFTPPVLMRLRRLARPLTFPNISAQVAIAYPDLSPSDITDFITEQQNTVMAAVEQIVISLLYKPLATEEYQAVARSYADGRGTGAAPILAALDESLKQTAWMYYMNSETATARAYNAQHVLV